MRIVFAVLLLAISGTMIAQNVGQEGDTLLNYVDINGFKQGHWKVYNISGEPTLEGYFVDNKPVGEFKKWDNTGRLYAHLFYKETEGDMHATFFHVSGKKGSEGNFVDKAKDSIWLYYSSQGVLMMQESYAVGIKHGVFKQYTIEGVLMEEVTWVNGVRQGVWKKYFTSGELMFEVNMINDQMEGETKSYYKNGNVYMEGKYVNDLKEGGWLKYAENGTFLKLYQYKNGISPESEAETQEKFEEYDRNKGNYPGPMNADDLDWLRGSNNGRY